MDKNDLRKLMIDKRKSISNKKELSTIIINKIINLDIYKKAKVIALYKSMDNEVDTNFLINEALNKKTLLLPKIIDNKIEFIKINKDTKYIKSNFEVMEPVGKIYKKEIDLIIIPGISFDKKHNRIGYGMGYYDKYLANKKYYKIGICFDEQVVDVIKNSKHDIKMDLIITNKKVY